MENTRFGSVASGSTPTATTGISSATSIYIHFNPVKHGLVARVRDWPYSSFHHYVRRGVLPEDWAGDFAHDRARFGEP